MPRMLTLTTHTDVRNWVSFRDGQPAIATERDIEGAVKARLKLAFAGDRTASRSVDEAQSGLSPCSWAAWLAEFDRQMLALEVPDNDDDDIRPADVKFVARQTRH